MRVEEPSQIVVLAVAGQRVLGQVVRAAGEEVHLLRQAVADDRRSRSLYHDADLDVLVIGDAFLPEFCFDLLAHLLCLAHLPYAGHHGEHDAQTAVGGSAVESSELGAEYLGPVEADAQSPVAQRRVLFLGHIEVSDLFVRSYVESAYYDFSSLHIGESFLICLELIVLGGIIVAVEI